jgi:NAD(P)H-dependent flavin oxidoreductase YrpB (nitropropane dioxygenase family)
VLSPASDPESGVRTVAAGAAGGGWGILDLGTGDPAACRALSQAVSWSAEPIGVRVPAGCAAVPDDVDQAGRGRVELVILPADSPWRVAEVSSRYRTFVEVRNRAEALAAAAAGAQGLIARGREAGGEDGELSTFVLLQLLLGDDDLSLPVWAAGGIGPYTAPACVLGGAAGVVLDRQLALMPESDLPADTLAAIRRCDGSDGSDDFLASMFAQRWPTTTAAVRGIRATILHELARDPAELPLGSETPLAKALGVPLPVAQGPMTRVSDEPAFAAAVAAAGGLPFVALAVNDAQRCRTMLTETAAAALDRPWGVGLLGFAPEQLRAEQLAVVKEVRPSCAIVAGGRPSQVKELEAHGITTFLHVPSPVLLRQFLEAGVRRFVFEGSECGGHIGPRASFPLWEAQLAVLDDYLDRRPDTDEAPIDVLFAGGIHDARSAVMATVAAATLARRGTRIGVLMGTAYLFTREAVDCQAIQPLFQRQALAAEHTVLLRTAPGHATRCLASPFADEFERQRAELESSGASAQQVWGRLEELNVGRLRIASKGLERTGDELVAVGENAQLTDGLFMAGQVATLRTALTTIADLHTEVTGTGVHVPCRPNPGAARGVRAGGGNGGRETGPARRRRGWARLRVPPGRRPRRDSGRTWSPAGTPSPRCPPSAGTWRPTTRPRPPTSDGAAPPSGAGSSTHALRRARLRHPAAALGHIEPVQLLALEVAARALPTPATRTTPRVRPLADRGDLRRRSRAPTSPGYRPSARCGPHSR